MACHNMVSGTWVEWSVGLLDVEMTRKTDPGQVDGRAASIAARVTAYPVDELEHLS